MPPEPDKSLSQQLKSALLKASAAKIAVLLGTLLASVLAWFGGESARRIAEGTGALLLLQIAVPLLGGLVCALWFLYRQWRKTEELKTNLTSESASMEQLRTELATEKARTKQLEEQVKAKLNTVEDLERRIAEKEAKIEELRKTASQVRPTCHCTPSGEAMLLRGRGLGSHEYQYVCPSCKRTQKADLPQRRR